MISTRISTVLAAWLLAASGWAPAARAAGDTIFSARCAMCHQRTGAGLPGQFPRLSGRVATIAASQAGRAYLVKVLLYGMFGAIDVDGRRINGMMPPMGSLADQDVADTLNFVVALEKPKKKVASFTAAEVKAVRSAGTLTASAVGKIRADLAAKGDVP